MRTAAQHGDERIAENAGEQDEQPAKARAHLKWEPTWNLESTLTYIVNWHRAWLQGDDMHARCVDEINSYMAAMASGA